MNARRTYVSAVLLCMGTLLASCGGGQTQKPASTDTPALAPTSAATPTPAVTPTRRATSTPRPTRTAVPTPIAYQKIYLNRTGVLSLSPSERDWMSGPQYVVCGNTGCSLSYVFTLTEPMSGNAYQYELVDLGVPGGSFSLLIYFRHQGQESLLAIWPAASESSGTELGQPFEGRYGDKIELRIELPPGSVFKEHSPKPGSTETKDSYIGIGYAAPTAIDTSVSAQ